MLNPPEGCQSRGFSSGSRRMQGDIQVDKSQCGPPKVGLDCKNFCLVVTGEYVTVRHPVGDGVLDESDKSITTDRAIAPDGGMACELFEGGVHAEFGLLYTGEKHLVMVKEVLQFCVAVLNTVAIDLQKPASPRGR